MCGKVVYVMMFVDDFKLYIEFEVSFGLRCEIFFEFDLNLFGEFFGIEGVWVVVDYWIEVFIVRGLEVIFIEWVVFWIMMYFVMD